MATLLRSGERLLLSLLARRAGVGLVASLLESFVLKRVDKTARAECEPPSPAPGRTAISPDVARQSERSRLRKPHVELTTSYFSTIPRLRRSCEPTGRILTRKPSCATIA
jgi:hypothetical protein